MQKPGIYTRNYKTRVFRSAQNSVVSIPENSANFYNSNSVTFAFEWELEVTSFFVYMLFLGSPWTYLDVDIGYIVRKVF